MSAGKAAAKSKQVRFGRLLTPEEAADKLAVAVQTLAHWRVRGTGPSFVHLSARCVRYPELALEEWISERLYQSTAENAVG
jgi:predicted DNA-binding transcriptional regulator AlpA